MRSLLFRHNLVLLKKVRRKLDGKWQQIPHFYIICEPESEWYTKCRDNGLKKCIRCKLDRPMEASSEFWRVIALQIRILERITMKLVIIQ